MSTVQRVSKDSTMLHWLAANLHFASSNERKSVQQDTLYKPAQAFEREKQDTKNGVRINKYQEVLRHTFERTAKLLLHA